MSEEIQRHNVIAVTNPFKKPFTASWDKVPYTIGAEETAYFPEWLAHHIADRMVDQLVQEQEGVQNIYNAVTRAKYKAPILSDIIQPGKIDKRTESEKVRDSVKDLQTSMPTKKKVEDDDGFDNIENSEPVDPVNGDYDEEAERKQVLKDNNPKGFRVEELDEMSYIDVQEVARGLEIEPVNVKKKELIGEIIKIEFKK